MLTPGEREEFEREGFIRIRQAFTRTEAARMTDRVWHALEELHGLSRDAPGHWPEVLVPRLQALRAEPVFEPIGSERTLAALDDLLGAERWERPRHWGQFLLTFPKVGESWTVPWAVWHTDFEYDAAPSAMAGALVFSCLSDVPPRTGGTAVLRGSPRLIAEFVKGQPSHVLEKMKRGRKAFLSSHRWLKSLSSESEDGDRLSRFMEVGETIEGVQVKVAELTGEAGDVIIGHPWLLHAPAPNCGRDLRIMRVQRLRSKAAPLPGAAHR